MKKYYKKYIAALYLSQKLFVALGACVLMYIMAFLLPLLLPIANIMVFFVAALSIMDYVLLFFTTKAPVAHRLVGDRLSNGDENMVRLNLFNKNNFALNLEIIDELPVQLQERNFVLSKKLAASQRQKVEYKIRPTSRGEYSFGDINIFAFSIVGFLKRKFVVEAQKTVSVFPSFINLRNQQLHSKAILMNNIGNKRLRKLGQSMEFEQIKDYVVGDDIRNINWKATARKTGLMVNHYTDEKSQQVYAIIDKGRLMKMPFNGLTLLDYAINSTLALSNICINKQDKFGLVSFEDKRTQIIAADRNPHQREIVANALFNQKTIFSESDFEMLYMQIRYKLKQRSLLILYTNFESLNGLFRQLGYLRSIAKHHLLLVVFFENTELKHLATSEVDNIDDIYVKTISEKFVVEKKLIVKELQRYGIMSMLTTPAGLTANTINKYLEIKARQLI